MYVRWRRRENGNTGPPRLSAILVQNRRVNGKPRQVHVSYLVSFTAESYPADVWADLLTKLDRLSNRITKEQRISIEAAIAAKVPKPSKKKISDILSWRTKNSFANMSLTNKAKVLQISRRCIGRGSVVFNHGIPALQEAVRTEVLNLTIGAQIAALDQSVQAEWLELYKEDKKLFQIVWRDEISKARLRAATENQLE